MQREFQIEHDRLMAAAESVMKELAEGGFLRLARAFAAHKLGVKDLTDQEAYVVFARMDEISAKYREMQKEQGNGQGDTTEL